MIVRRDSTFQIRAINPENIVSLTERAFFNSFNLEKIISKEEEEENPGKKVESEDKRERKPDRTERVDKDGKKIENDEDDKCLICGKGGYTNSEWIQCSNENKCRGSGWYHQQCVGITGKPEDIPPMDFICEYCRRPQEEEKESESSQKRFKSN